MLNIGKVGCRLSVCNVSGYTSKRIVLMKQRKTDLEKMERYKDEAVKAKEMAQKKLAEMDLAGAKMFAEMALTLYPRLDDLHQLLATVHVHLSAEKRINGEVDWYAVLGVEPLAQVDAIRKSYRRLALMLHPDKNKLTGADEAFKILSQAWSVLSDETKRRAHDQNRNFWDFFQSFQNQKSASSSSAPCNHNGFHSFSNANANDSNAKDQMRGTSSPTPRERPIPSTFWTICSTCKLLLEYNRIFVNRNICCANCGHVFLAIETSEPPINGNTSTAPPTSGTWQKNCNKRKAAKNSRSSGKKPTPASNQEPPRFSGMDSSKETLQSGGFLNYNGSGNAAPAPTSSAAQVGGIFRSAYEQANGGCGGAATHVVRDEAPKIFGFTFGSSGEKPTAGFNQGPARSSGGMDSLKEIFQSGTSSKSGGSGKAPVPGMSTAQATGILEPVILRGSGGKPIAVVRNEAPHLKTQTAAQTGAGSSVGSPRANSASSLNGNRPKKRPRDEHASNYRGRKMGNHAASSNVGVGKSRSRKGNSGTRKMKSAGVSSRGGARESPDEVTSKVLIKRTTTEIHKKLEEWSRISASKTIEKEKKDKKKAKRTTAASGVNAEAKKFTELMETKINNYIRNSSPANSDPDSDIQSAEPKLMSVTDPDFNDFDKDRMEKSFGSKQIWAAYDEEDGMPRYYAMVHSVMSLKPFKMLISWLNPKSKDSLTSPNWIGPGFPKSIGEFRKTKYVVSDSLNSFSHKVKWTKGYKGPIHIYPKKGDVWALYKNWSPDWNKNTPNEVIRKYDMVEVLEDYNAETGITVAPLVKVAGFKTVFSGLPNKAKAIPREEMFRFSHQVPFYLLTGKEGNSAPAGCWELDPASIPMELLQVLTEARLKETAEEADKAKEENVLGGVKRSDKKELPENCKTRGEESYTAKAAGKCVVGDDGMINEKKANNRDGLVVYKRRR